MKELHCAIENGSEKAVHFEVTREPFSIRLVFQSAEERATIQPLLGKLLPQLCKSGIPRKYFYARGSYADFSARYS